MISTSVYINLEKDTLRQEAMQKQLRKLKLPAKRFVAINGKELKKLPKRLTKGEYGCWLSHYNVIKNSINLPTHLHIMEDDVVISDKLIPILQQLDKFTLDWDIIYTDAVMFPLHVKTFQILEHERRKAKANEIKLINAKKLSFTGASSYIINKKSIPKIVKLMEHPNASTIAIDNYMRALSQSGEINAYITFPFLTTISDHSLKSSIRGDLDDARKVLDIYRKSFYIDSEIEKISDTLKTWSKQKENDIHQQIFLDTAKILLNNHLII